MRRPLLFAAALTAILAFAGSASAVDGAGFVRPTAKQTSAIVKTFNAGEGTSAPASCFDIRISKHSRNIAAVLTKQTSVCQSVSDTHALMYAGKGAWFELAVANTGTLKAPQCQGLQTLIGIAAWQDLAGPIGSMGCENID